MDELTAMILMTVTIFAGIWLLDWVCDVDDRNPPPPGASSK